MSTAPVYLTFDLGTSALKTALVSGRGEMLAVDTAEYTFLTPHPGWVEMDPETYWRAAVSGTREVLRKSGIDPASVNAIGFSSQGQTFVPIGADRKPLYNAVVWLDERAGEIAADWHRKWLSREIFQITSGYPIVTPLLTVFKLAWFAHNMPRVTSAWKYLCLPDYLIFRMTGEAWTDYTTAHATGMYDIHFENWESTLMNWAAEVNLEQMPLIVAPGEVVAKLSGEAADELGLPGGIPVCVGANDQLCGAIGAANVREGVITETTGTAMAVVATTNELLEDFALVVGPHPIEGKFFAMSCAPTAGIVLKWLRALCCEGESYEEFLSKVDEVSIGCDGLTALPHFGGTGSPDWRSDARGAFAGITLGHTRTHFARAIMESCCCVLKELLDLVTKHGLAPDTVRSLGGAARSNLWLQMKANLLGTPVERPLCSDAASLGAAMLAARGTGAYGSLQEVSDDWYRPGTVFEPDPVRTEAYRAVYDRYLAAQRLLYERTDE